MVNRVSAAMASGEPRSIHDLRARGRQEIAPRVRRKKKAPEVSHRGF